MMMGIIQKYTDILDEKSLKNELREFMSGPVHIDKEEKYKPMLNELLTREFIELENHVETWEEAIRVGRNLYYKVDIFLKNIFLK